jgi:hypothetical protein
MGGSYLYEGFIGNWFLIENGVITGAGYLSGPLFFLEPVFNIKKRPGFPGRSF